MPLSAAHRQEIHDLSPIDQGQKARLIEIVGVYRNTLLGELRHATTTAQRSAARQRYLDILGEMDTVSANTSNPITECYRTYCRCILNPQGHDCRADLAICLDNAGLPPAAPRTGIHINEGIVPDANAL